MRREAGEAGDDRLQPSVSWSPVVNMAPVMMMMDTMMKRNVR